ncbi:N-acetylglucosamine-6-phosphate deacetylase [Lacihabitans sp. LS3-19]|uniref:N-acetylglucosamine-6-phosphate deacetylase n=1 Tax=Lacihabitans sp. LS3-19 TaxID=2487335 RepID=UPI0020CE3331|nr:N-acetylglucosamine-6-phosphate deacetylase [Lacihabitans sp. LS3-19]MCP9766890.1 N-acetylglucosamine-6-phosphate deacetylase [Lacihabitans sp. LS3-19]
MKNITCKKLYTPNEVLINQKIWIENGLISKIEHLNSDEIAEFENLAPTLIDLHINGGEQFHFTQKPERETLIDIEFSAKKNGVGYVLPTLITSSIDNIFRGLETIKNYCKENPNSGVLGMHLEGPFLSIKKRGAHLEKYIKKPDNQTLREIIDFGGESLKMITIAPENFTNEQILMLLESGIKVSLGHSNCTFERAKEAFGLGVNLVTHLFNAMSPFTHREPGLAGASLSNNQVFTPLILDDVHVATDAARLAFKLKKEKMFLISDALFQNHKKERFQWEEFDAFITDGNYMNSDGNLAGATISLADAVRNAKNWLSVDTKYALKMATEIPAEVMNFNIGKIEVGAKVKFSCFNDDLEEFQYIEI